MLLTMLVSQNGSQLYFIKAAVFDNYIIKNIVQDYKEIYILKIQITNQNQKI